MLYIYVVALWEQLYYIILSLCFIYNKQVTLFNVHKRGSLKYL